MTKTTFSTRNVTSIVAALATSVLIAAGVAAQDTRVGVDRDFEVPSVTQAAIEATADFTPTITAFDAMIADLTVAAAPVVTTSYDNMIADLTVAAAPVVTAYDAMVADLRAR